MTEKFKKLQEIDAMIGSMYKDKPDLRHSKFAYAYKKFADKSYYPNLKTYYEEINDACVANALTNKETGAMIINDKNPRGFDFDKEGLKQVIKAERRIKGEWDDKDIEVFPFNCTDIPSDLSDEQKELFEGLIINVSKKESAEASS